MWKAEEALDTLNKLVDWEIEYYMNYEMLTRSTPSDDKST